MMALPRQTFPENGIVRASENDTADLICQRIFGYTDGITEQILALNPGLAKHGPFLPQGTPLTLPRPDQLATRRPASIHLWN